MVSGTRRIPQIKYQMISKVARGQVMTKISTCLKSAPPTIARIPKNWSIIIWPTYLRFFDKEGLKAVPKKE